MHRSGRHLLSAVLWRCRRGAPGLLQGWDCNLGCARITNTVAGFRIPPQGREVATSALQRTLVLPRLLDTLSGQYHQSKQGMDGLLQQMTAELEKVRLAAVTPAKQ